MDDYPWRALQQQREGTASFRLSSGTDGRVLDCIISQSSGHNDLDAATCTHVARRARFYPAAAADGVPTHRVFEGDVNWKIPR